MENLWALKHDNEILFAAVEIEENDMEYTHRTIGLNVLNGEYVVRCANQRVFSAGSYYKAMHDAWHSFLYGKESVTKVIAFCC